MIVLKNVSKTFSRRKVLDDVSLQVDPGEFVCITGTSGAGKSTLMHILAGAETATMGTVEVDGVDLRIVPPIALRIFRRRVGVVFQDYKLLPHKTVAQNIAFPLEVCGATNVQIEGRVTELLRQMHLVKVANALPRELSGGEQARAAIARAIVHSPYILLADEPTGNLDPAQSLLILKLFKAINKDGTTVVIATHDSGLVDALKERVITLEDGRVVRDSPGGYRKATANKTKSEPVSVHEKPTEKPIKVESLDPKRRKVRITAIRS
ncbi:ATP-binding cassette domain-containing protein [Patescibacteria group bacterium]|nr:ATP-binding cassette domain-containing protein [Patescibacteria group bacterium]MBU2260009.1 ATP-binding cassette domain-containing protein [Patescibacteria group bacterium]